MIAVITSSPESSCKILSMEFLISLLNSLWFTIFCSFRTLYIFLYIVFISVIVSVRVLLGFFFFFGFFGFSWVLFNPLGFCGLSLGGLPPFLPFSLFLSTTFSWYFWSCSDQKFWIWAITYFNESGNGGGSCPFLRASIYLNKIPAVSLSIISVYAIRSLQITVVLFSFFAILL